MPSSTRTETSPGATRPPRAASAARILITGRELRQAPLLAADAEHLDPVDARRVAPGQQPAPLVRALRLRLRLVQTPVAQRDRRAVVLGHVEHERLRGLLGGRRAAPRPPAAPSRDRTSATNAGTRQAIASARISVLPSSSPISLASVSISRISSSELVAARPVGAHQHRGEAACGRRSRRAMAIALVRTIAAALVLALEVQRAGEPAEQPDAQLRARPRRARRPPPRAARPAPGSAMPGRQHASS